MPELAYYLMLLAALVAGATALGCSRAPTFDRRTIFCLAFGLGLWAVGMGNAIANSDAEQNLISTYVYFVSYGLPLLYAAVATRDEPTTTSRRLVDGGLLLLLVTLCYLGVRDLQDDHGFLRGEYEPWVALAFDAENVLLLLAFLVRSLAAMDEREYRSFRVVTIFLGIYALTAAVHNHIDQFTELAVFGAIGDTLPTLTFTLLICLLHSNRRPGAFELNHHIWARRLAASFAPGVLLAAIFAFSVGIRGSQGVLGQIMLALAMLTYVIRVVQTQFWFAATRDRLAEALAAVERVSLLDELTGIPNRRAFESALGERLRESMRDHRPISALMIDVDRFKIFNDSRGHLDGDVALKAVARLLAGTLRRPADFIARYGGEEFVVLLPNTAEEGAQVVARRMNRSVYEAALAFDLGIDQRVTVSIGIATTDELGGAELIKRADVALYCAKAGGRNGHAAAADEWPIASFP
ncbi:MAG TPA: GGDEF domain-containing protein [Luteibacter sp.]|uniref:GGDEF domain-containing protein n=1 Tax=Luteibacter sp. TaxID=1886636 RepID=UPI002F4252D8